MAGNSGRFLYSSPSTGSPPEVSRMQGRSRRPRAGGGGCRKYAIFLDLMHEICRYWDMVAGVAPLFPIFFTPGGGGGGGAQLEEEADK